MRDCLTKDSFRVLDWDLEEFEQLEVEFIKYSLTSSKIFDIIKV